MMQPQVLIAFLGLPNGQVQEQIAVKDPQFLVQAAQRLLDRAAQEMMREKGQTSNIMLPDGKIV